MFKQFTNFYHQVWHRRFYLFILYSSYVVIFLSYLGIAHFSPHLIQYMHTFIKYYICVVLLLVFNPWVKKKCDPFDNSIAFSAGFLILFAGWWA